jgi:hypothetical protein
MDPKIEADLEGAEDGTIDMKKLSAGQKKKLKEKAKKEADDKAAAEKAASGAPAEEVKGAPAKGGAKPKKGNAMAEMAREKQRLIAEAQAELDSNNFKIEEAARIKRETREAEEKRLFDIDEAKKKEKRDAIQALKDKG